jgi:hypothetical protein
MELQVSLIVRALFVPRNRRVKCIAFNLGKIGMRSKIKNPTSKI